MTKIRDILHFIQQSGVLMLMPRSHIKHLGTFEAVAAHTYQCAVISYCIARMENLSHEEALNCLAMALFHDLAEAKTGDMDFISKHYVTVDEEKAVQDQFKKLEFKNDLQNTINEYEERESKASKCVKDADSLAQMYIEWMYMWQGNKLAEKWFSSDFNDRVPAFYTESARKLAFVMKDSNPNEWWWSELMDDDAAADIEKLVGKRK